MREILKSAFPRTLPVMAGYLFLGVAYGVSLKAEGFGPEWALLISGAVYAGSMQFAMLGLMAGPFAPVTAVMMTLMVNARHLFYGLSMLNKYGRAGKYKPYLIFSLTDETYSLVCGGAPEGVDEGLWYTCVSALDQLYWVAGSVAGALLGQMLPLNLTGIDFAMTALFTVIVTEQCMDAAKQVKEGKLGLTDALFPPVMSVAVTLICLVTVGSSSFLPVAMALMLALFFLRYRLGNGEARA